jgi:hypothetical protein
MFAFRESPKTNAISSVPRQRMKKYGQATPAREAKANLSARNGSEPRVFGPATIDPDLE